MTDEDLLSRLQCGDTSAWKPFYARCLPTVWRYAWSFVGEHSAAEDITGEVMLALVRQIDELDVQAGSIHAWLRAVVRHKVSDFHRQKARQKRLVAAVADHIRSSAGVSSSPDFEPLDEHDDIDRILDQLRDNERQALEWKYLDQLSVRVIAVRLGQTEKSVEAILYRARREFRRLHHQRHDSES